MGDHVEPSRVERLVAGPHLPGLHVHNQHPVGMSPNAFRHTASKTNAMLVRSPQWLVNLLPTLFTFCDWTSIQGASATAPT